MTEERIMTLHPAGKAGVSIDREKYETVAGAIRTALSEKVLTFQELTEAVNADLTGNFDGSISWYVTTVKLDLEARGELQRVDNKSPQRLRLTAS